MRAGELRLLVGLGNPGTKYKNTRHNIGYMAISMLAKKEGVYFRQQNKLHGSLAEIGSGSNRLRLLMPNTYMNESGRSIRAALDWFDLGVEQILVLVDDMDLPLGRLRLRAKGSAGGHNGLKSSINHLGTQNFSRLRIGIGSPSYIPAERRAKTISHVLGTFSKEESNLVDEILGEVLIGLDLIQSLGLERAGNRLNAYQSKGGLNQE